MPSGSWIARAVGIMAVCVVALMVTAAVWSDATFPSNEPSPYPQLELFMLIPMFSLGLFFPFVLAKVPLLEGVARFAWLIYFAMAIVLLSVRSHTTRRRVWLTLAVLLAINAIG